MNNRRGEWPTSESWVPHISKRCGREHGEQTGEPTVSFTYTATGKRQSMSDASGTTNYTYGSMDRLITKATSERHSHDTIETVTLLQVVMHLRFAVLADHFHFPAQNKHES